MTCAQRQCYAEAVVDVNDASFCEEHEAHYWFLRQELGKPHEVALSILTD